MYCIGFQTNLVQSYTLIYSIKPTLKKVSKYENKFAKLQKKAGEFNFRQQLKAVTKKEYTMEEEGAGVSKIMVCYQEHSWVKRMMSFQEHVSFEIG